MYKIGIVVASDKLVRYPWINLKGIMNDSNQNLYKFIVFQQEQYERLFSQMKLGDLDAVVFSSNVSNDERIRNLILDNRDTITQFVKQGKGVLLLLQYRLARKNEVFDIFDKNIFNDETVADSTDKKLSKENGLVEVSVTTTVFDDKKAVDNTNNNSSEDKGFFSVSFISDKVNDGKCEQNTVVQNEEGEFDESKVYLEEGSILLSYPNQIKIKEDVYDRSQGIKFAKSFAPAYIEEYPHAYFVAPFCLETENDSKNDSENNSNTKQRKPLLIYSPNNERRIIITTLPADLQEQNRLLENMISYITRGRPEAILWKADSCKSDECQQSCKVEDYLTRAKIHFFSIDQKKTNYLTSITNIDSEDPVIKDLSLIVSRSKYVIACGSSAYDSCRKVSKKIPLPSVKTPFYSISGSDTQNEAEASQKRIIVDVPAKSQIELWAIQGFNYLLDRFPSNDKYNNKWDTLYATEQVLQLADELGQYIPDYISEQIANYLNEHNGDGETFDNVPGATRVADNIYQILNKRTKNFKLPDLKFDVAKFSDSDMEKKEVDVNSATLFDLAQLILNTDSDEELAALQGLDTIITRFVTERNPKKAAWEDDVMTTACVLRALRKIDKCSDINTSLTNLICSCFDSKDNLELTEALSKSVENARQSEFDAKKQLLLEKRKHEEEIKKKNEEIAANEEDIVTKNNLIKEKDRDIDTRDKKLVEKNDDIKEKENTIKEKDNDMKIKSMQDRAWFVLLVGLFVLSVCVFISFIIQAQSFEQSNWKTEVDDFFVQGWQIGSAILAILGTIVTIIVVGSVKYKIINKRDDKKEDENKGNEEANAQTINNDDEENKSESEAK